MILVFYIFIILVDHEYGDHCISFKVLILNVFSEFHIKYVRYELFKKNPNTYVGGI